MVKYLWCYDPNCLDKSDLKLENVFDSKKECMNDARFNAECDEEWFIVEVKTKPISSYKNGYKLIKLS